MSTDRSILDAIYDNEQQRARQVFLTQPVGGAQVVDSTWAQMMDQARRMARHLREERGLRPGDRIAMLSKNCAHFFMAELAIWMAGGTTVAIFPTETAETVRYVLEHSEASLLFVGKLDAWPQQLPGVPAQLPCIAFPLAPQTPYERWDDIVARTEPLSGHPQRAGTDLGMIIYTSGSTGLPKGVMLPFDAIGAAAGMVDYLKATYGDEQQTRLISYLPLAHSFERAWVLAASLYDGSAHIFFAEAVDTFLEDLRRARPTTFISVPRLWLKFQQGVFAKVPPARLDRLLGIPIVGKLVARKILKGLGLDAVRHAASGSAPIPADLIRWYRKLGLNLFEGYGMTEDFAYSHSSTRERNAPGFVGVPLPGVQAKLADDGEILIKSPGQFCGYYRQPELNAQVFTPDGFFRTGDQGERDASGLLKVTGRVKEIFKTSKGEYVAPAPIENRLNAHPMVELSLVSGMGQAAAYAMVVLAEELRPRLGDAALRGQVQAELARLLQDVNRQLPAHQRLKMIVVANEPWSIENGLLTPTMKIRRGRIESAVAFAVEHWYASGSTVHWA